MNLSDEIWLRAVAEVEEDAISSASAVSVSEAERFLSEAGFDAKQERARALEIIAKLKGAHDPASEAGAPDREKTAPAKNGIAAANGAAAAGSVAGTAPNGAARRANGTKSPASEAADAAKEAGDAAIESAAWVSGPSAPARVPRPSRRLVWLAAALLAAATTGGIVYAVGHRSKPPENPFEPPREAPSAPTASATASVRPPRSPQPAAPPSSPAKVPGYNDFGKPLGKGR